MEVSSPKGSTPSEGIGRMRRVWRPPSAAQLPSRSGSACLGIRLSVGCPLTIREPWGLPCLPWHRFSVGWPLIIQTILLYPSGAVWTDEASNVSRPDPSGADQTDVEHQATDLAVELDHTDFRWRKTC